MSRTGRTAKILVLIGLGLQIAEELAVAWLTVGLLSAPPFSILVGFFLAIGIVWLVLVYVFSYRRVAEGDFAGASAPTLVFAILSLLTLSLVSGVLYIVAYADLSKAEAEQRAAVYGGVPGWNPAALPSSSFVVAAPGTMFCPRCGQPRPASARFCPTCGNQLG